MKYQNILNKAINDQELTFDEGVFLYEEAPLEALQKAANQIRINKTNPKTVSYLIDRNINYTNVCITNCKFCNFYRTPQHDGAYVLSKEILREKIEETIAVGGTRILMQGGHHPDLRLDWYIELLTWLKKEFPSIELDCFSPSEIDNICLLENKDAETILKALIEAGLQGLPGGGAELLDDEIRQKVSPKKISGSRWLEIMEIAHKLNLHTSASMVIGFGENAKNRIKHFDLLRNQQKKSLNKYNNGFIAFIAWPLQHELTPLGKQSQNSGKLGATKEEYLRNLAIARIYLNPYFENIQASWPTMGFKVAQEALSYGANDFGSTMLEENVVSQASTKTHKFILVDDICKLINEAGYKPVQRLTDYSIL
ncbi:MAG: dehypoxanthine futalosine cyclase [Candidatus Cloacimonadota bacterium]|nr:MAG: dehypoxanthine futalosine cyclase [Candidatus Cloacimonadota bacterium]